MWGRKEPEAKQNNPAETGGTGEFEAAAARVTAAEPIPSPDAPSQPEGQKPVERLLIRPSWGEGVARACFLPPAKLIHPAYALTDDEAEVIGPKMAAFLQALVDRYEYLVPQWAARVSNRFPEFGDLLAALGVAGYAKYELVKKLRKLEEEERRAKAAANVTPIQNDSEAIGEKRRYKTGERMEDGTLVV